MAPSIPEIPKDPSVRDLLGRANLQDSSVMTWMMD